MPTMARELYVHFSQTAFRGCRMLHSVGGLVTRTGGGVAGVHLTEQVVKVCQKHGVCGCWQCLDIGLVDMAQTSSFWEQTNARYLPREHGCVDVTLQR